MDLGLLVLRVVIGALFAGHGAQKLFGWFGGAGLDGTARFFDGIGLRPARTMAILAGAAEMAGGALLALGLLTPVAAMLLSAVLVVAIAAVHLAHGPWAADGGWEYNAVLLAAVFAVCAIGAGAWSLDGALGLELAGAGYAIAALAGGSLGAAATLMLEPARAHRGRGSGRRHGGGGVATVVGR